MKRLLIASVALLTALPVAAADLINRDSRSYDVKIMDVGTTHSSISSNTHRTSVCSSCEIEVVGVGSIRVESGDDKVIIKDGSLSKE